jgi:hypothetical protein
MKPGISAQEVHSSNFAARLDSLRFVVDVGVARHLGRVNVDRSAVDWIGGPRDAGGCRHDPLECHMHALVARPRRRQEREGIAILSRPPFSPE